MLFTFFFLITGRLFRYEGEESLLQGNVLESGGEIYAASRIASMALNSCALHLETGGVCLVASLLEAAHSRSAGGHRRIDPLLRLNAGLAREKVKNCISKSVDIPSISSQFPFVF